MISPYKILLLPNCALSSWNVFHIKWYKSSGKFVFLIKPQFEAKREEIQKGGVVRDEKIHNKIIEDIKDYAKNLELNFQGVIKSPIQGAKQGNVEYLIYFKRGEI